MNKTARVLLLLLIIGIGAYVALGGLKEKETGTEIPTASSTPETTNPTPAKKPTTKTTTPTSGFTSIFKTTGSYECVFDQATAAGKTNKIIYLADGAMRGEFRSNMENTPTTLMVYNGGYLYTWTEGSARGTKTRINSVSDLPSIVPTDLSKAASLGSSLNNVSWGCHPWIKNASLLKAPSYVQF